jgi:hypothetical protein
MALSVEERIARQVTVHRLDRLHVFEVCERLHRSADYVQEIRALGMISPSLVVRYGVFCRHPSAASELSDSPELITECATRVLSAVSLLPATAGESHGHLLGEFDPILHGLTAIGDIVQAERVAREVLSPAMCKYDLADDGDQIRACHARLLAATLVGQRTIFYDEMDRWLAVTEGLFFYKEYWPYVDLMSFLLEKDERSLETGFRKADATFLARDTLIYSPT